MITKEFYSSLDEIRVRELVNVTCDGCNKEFKVTKRTLYKALKDNNKHLCCSAKCLQKCRDTGKVYPCTNCLKQSHKTMGDINRSKTGKFFCSSSCAATYNNTHKTHGTRRSKLEIWLEEQLALKYPTLFIAYSDKQTINSELDIYIPTLNLAFELNGIFHYEPIYGKDTLNKIQNNDSRKFQACLENNIELCIIDTQAQKKFTKDSSKQFLSIICSIIDLKLS